MKKVLQIFQRDLKRLLRSPAAALVMVSLHSPFSLCMVQHCRQHGSLRQYKNVKVAIANCDTGGHTGSMDLNAGGTIVQNLKKSPAWLDLC